MGLFTKNRSDNYINDDDKKDCSEWAEQARKARNPGLLTPEELLGFSLDKAETTPVAEATVAVKDTFEKQDAFPDGTVRSLYERMLGSREKNAAARAASVHAESESVMSRIFSAAPDRTVQNKAEIIPDAAESKQNSFDEPVNKPADESANKTVAECNTEQAVDGDAKHMDERSAETTARHESVHKEPVKAFDTAAVTAEAAADSAVAAAASADTTPTTTATTVTTAAAATDAATAAASATVANTAAARTTLGRIDLRSIDDVEFAKEEAAEESGIESALGAAASDNSAKNSDPPHSDKGSPKAGKNDEFADFFRRLDSEMTADARRSTVDADDVSFEKLLGSTESETTHRNDTKAENAAQNTGGFSSPDDFSDDERKKIDELMKAVYGTASSSTSSSSSAAPSSVSSTAASSDSSFTSSSVAQSTSPADRIIKKSAFSNSHAGHEDVSFENTTVFDAVRPRAGGTSSYDGDHDFPTAAIPTDEVISGAASGAADALGTASTLGAAGTLEAAGSAISSAGAAVSGAAGKTRITPRHSLYGGETTTIDRKAIDDFFNDSFEDEEDNNKKKKQRSKKNDPAAAAASRDDAPADRRRVIPDIYESEPEEKVTDVFNDPGEDYESLNNAAEIKEQLLTRKKRLTVRTVLTSVLTLLMIILNGFFFSLRGMELGIVPNIANLVLLIIAAAVNYRSFIGMFRGEFDVDFCCSAVTIGIVIQSAVSLIVFNGAGAGLGALAGTAMLINLAGKHAACSATLKSICTIATSEPKLAVLPIEDENVSLEVAGGAAEGEAAVCYGKKTVNVHGFLKNWYRPTPADRGAARLVVISIVVSLLMALASALIFNVTTENALSVFSVALSLCCAPTVYLLNRLSAKIMTDELKYYDASVAGTNAARAISDCNVVAVSASELFPAGSVVLHNMMPLSANSVDKSISMAASVAIAADSPLSNIFKDIVRDSIDKLPKAEDVKYENKLGISGWVGDECVIIGGRAIMESHNIKTPSVEFDRKIMAAGYKPVYLACGGKPCLLFVVRYLADESVKFEIQRLCNTGTAVVVNSTDPNVTKQLICEYFELADDDVWLMSRSGASKLSSLNSFKESCNGFAAVKAKTCGIIAAVSASVRLLSIDAVMRAFHIIGIISGIAGLGLLLYTKGFSATTALLALALEIVFTAIVTAVPYIRRP